MYRLAIELLFTFVIIMVARAVLTSVMKGISNASVNAAPGARPAKRGPAAQASGELYKDPVCGTYVAGSTVFRRQVGAQSFYYCSEACREKHALVAR